MAIRLVKHSEVIDALPAPTYLTLTGSRSLHGTMLVAFDAQLVGWIVESRFGGNGRFPATIPVREFTAFEQNSMRRVVEILLQQWAAAWEPIAALEPLILRHEANPHFSHFANSLDLVIACDFDVKVGRGGGRFTIAMPHAMLEPLHEKLVASTVAEPVDVDRSWFAALQFGVEGAVTTLTVELAAIEMTVRDFLALQPGYVFEIDRPEAVTVEAAGRPLFRGRWGRHGRRIAVRIEERLDPVADASTLEKIVAGSG
jgi:flagellar motor switch protein FliM